MIEIDKLKLAMMETEAQIYDDFKRTPDHIVFYYPGKDRPQE